MKTIFARLAIAMSALVFVATPNTIALAEQCNSEKQAMQAAMESYKYYKDWYNQASNEVGRLQRETTDAFNRGDNAEFQRLGAELEQAKRDRSTADAGQNRYWGEFLSAQTTYQNCLNR